MGNYHPSRRMDGLERLEQTRIERELNKPRLLLPGDGDDGDIVLEDVSVSEITETNLADHQADKSSFRAELAEGTTDLGAGFLMKEEPVIVDRDVRTGRITRLTPLNEIPGVEYYDGRTTFEPKTLTEDDLAVAEAKEKIYPVDRDTRHKLVGIMAARLLKHYSKLGDDYPGFNPLRDGVPEIPAGSSEFLEPKAGTPLYPATRAQVFEYLKREVGKRASFINKQRFGTDGKPDLRDLDIRIQ
jgi:hypothetical protein